jgi:hypothetical protein
LVNAEVEGVGPEITEVSNVTAPPDSNVATTSANEEIGVNPSLTRLPVTPSCRFGFRRDAVAVTVTLKDSPVATPVSVRIEAVYVAEAVVLPIVDLVAVTVRTFPAGVAVPPVTVPLHATTKPGGRVTVAVPLEETVAVYAELVPFATAIVAPEPV